MTIEQFQLNGEAYHMKKFYLFGLIVFCLFMVLGLRVYIRSNVTVEWDAPSYSGDGVMSYNVILQDMETGTSTVLGNTAATEFTFDVPVNKSWLVGVQTVITDADGDHLSDFLMSDNGDNPVPFGLLQAAPQVKNIRIK